MSKKTLLAVVYIKFCSDYDRNYAPIKMYWNFHSYKNDTACFLNSLICSNYLNFVTWHSVTPKPLSSLHSQKKNLAWEYRPCTINRFVMMLAHSFMFSELMFHLAASMWWLSNCSLYFCSSRPCPFLNNWAEKNVGEIVSKNITHKK